MSLSPLSLSPHVSLSLCLFPFFNFPPPSFSLSAFLTSRCCSEREIKAPPPQKKQTVIIYQKRAGAVSARRLPIGVFPFSFFPHCRSTCCHWRTKCTTYRISDALKAPSSYRSLLAVVALMYDSQVNSPLIHLGREINVKVTYCIL